MGEAIAVADDELVKAVARIEPTEIGLVAGGLPTARGLSRGGVAGERDLGLGSEHLADTTLQRPAVAFAQPACSLFGTGEKEGVALQRMQLQRLDPHGVLGLPESAAQSGPDLAPG